MDVIFSDRKIQRLCAEEKEGIKKLGQQCARRLRARLADILAAPTLEDLRGAPGRLHELTGDRKGQLAMDLLQPYRLILEPTEDPPPRKEDGGLNWREVTAATVVEIVDYH